MTGRRRPPLTTLLLAMSVLAASSTFVNAHPADVYYPHPWATDAFGDVTVTWRFTPEFPDDFPEDTGFQRRIRDGAQTWNNVGANLRFAEVAAAPNDYAARGCGNQLLQGTDRNGMHWEAIDGRGNVLARTYQCIGTVGVNAGRMYSFDMQWDPAEWWHIHTGSPPSGTTDVWSVASHEFGHATDWEMHFDDNAGWNGSLCQTGDAGRHTMCKYYEPGTLRMRTLEAHDVETFVNRYGR